LTIKASGFSLSEVEEDKGYSQLNNKQLLSIFDDTKITSSLDKKQRENFAKEKVYQALLTPDSRPSIETLLHALLDTVTLHVHPIVVNAITCQVEWKETITMLFGEHVLCVPYHTPGIDLALALKKEMETKKSPIIFLQNHGLIVTAKNVSDVIKITEQVVSVIEAYLKVDYSHYKYTNIFSALINKISKQPMIAYLSRDKELLDLLKEEKKIHKYEHFCPDTLVYCGLQFITMISLDDVEINLYMKKYNEIPRVISFKKKLFFIAPSVKKAKEMEDVFKFHFLTWHLACKNIERKEKINVLSDHEIKYLNNWEAEKYRQKL